MWRKTAVTRNNHIEMWRKTAVTRNNHIEIWRKLAVHVETNERFVYNKQIDNSNYLFGLFD